MVSLVSSHANASSKRWRLWEVDSRFALDSTSGRLTTSSLFRCRSLDYSVIHHGMLYHPTAVLFTVGRSILSILDLAFLLCRFKQSKTYRRGLIL